MRSIFSFKQIILTFVMASAFLQPLVSAPVDTAAARKAATHFYNWRTGRSVSEDYAQLVYIRQTTPQGTHLQTAPANALYVFNFGNHFVMTSADTRVIPVLAYSTESGFSTEGHSSSLEWFLDEYVREIESILLEVDDNESPATVDEWNRWISGNAPIMATTTSVAPLLKTLWNQNAPYNSLCPADPLGPGGHAYAGCVACALSQIIRYWQYPSSGIGSHSYAANFSSTNSNYGNYGIQSVDFSAATYDFSLMPLSLNSGSTSVQINEVAKLMYHCGVAVEMMYGAGSSGAYDNMAVNALNTYFGYSGANLKYKSSYLNNAWLSLVKAELDNLRPVYYSGNGTGGHAFLCDGYDDQNLFHFNWGWGGNYNGYYSLSNLNPGNYNFTSSQLAIIGIDASQPTIHPSLRSLSFLTEGGTVSESKTISVLAANLGSSITATVTGNFKISTNNTNFYTSRTLSSQGGTLYVRYHPTVSSGSETGRLVLTSGNVSDTILLTGTVYDPYPHCLPPEDLSISSQNLQDITIQWNAPVLDPDPHTLTWSSGSAYMNYGYGSDYKKSMLQRFCDTDLVACHNQALTSIRFYARNGATTYKAVVYKGGSYNGSFDPGTLVLSQDINLSSLTMDDWNTVTLNTPVLVDAEQELWFGIYIEAPGGTYCIPLSSQYRSKKGCICGTHNSGSASWGEFDDSHTFCIQGTVKNVQTLTNYQVTRNGTAIGTTTSTSFQDHVSGTNTYTYVVTANWSNGCSSSAQRSFTNIAQITATPEVVDFFANYGYGTLVKTVTVGGIGLTANITASVSGNFLLSTNGTQYANSVSLPLTGGTLYVKYTPTSFDSEYETGLITLTSGSLSTTIPLSGQCHAGCNPPQNLTLSQSGNTVGLDWNAATAPVLQQESLTWLNTVVPMHYGSSSETKRFLVQRFTTEDLAPYHGKRLKSISFIPDPDATTYRLVVFKGGSSNGYYFQSGTQVTDQSVNRSSLTDDTWNEIMLETPVTIEANQELWFGIYLESPAGTYPILMATPYVAKKGCISRMATTPSNYWNEYTTSSYCFALKATVEDVPITLTHYQIDRDGETVNTTGNTSYDDHLIYNGLYDYDVWAVWSDGCRAPARSSITVSGLCDRVGETYTETACDSYVWHGTTYTHSGTYYYTYTLPNGCPGVDTLVLTVHYGTHNVETQTACESFTWYGHTYTQSGTYTYAYSNAHGCASVDTLKLTVHYGTHNVVTQTACESYTWHGHTYTQSGTYTYAYSNAHGCASVDTLKLTVHYGTHNVVTQTACESYTWYGHTYTQSGTYTYAYSNAHGCASVDTLKLTVHYGTHN
ncbi:MAG: C10 family peptidase, partial [Bacteroidales bacterium]|nr:C10 family peptidase [Bacteroidales bacterium]